MINKTGSAGNWVISSWKGKLRIILQKILFYFFLFGISGCILHKFREYLSDGFINSAGYRGKFFLAGQIIDGLQDGHRLDGQHFKRIVNHFPGHQWPHCNPCSRYPGCRCCSECCAHTSGKRGSGFPQPWKQP